MKLNAAMLNLEEKILQQKVLYDDCAANFFLIYNLPGAYPRVEHLKGASLVWAPALPANIGLGWKDFPGTNTLAYYENP
jgi:hypothetical protein